MGKSGNSVLVFIALVVIISSSVLLFKVYTSEDFLKNIDFSEPETIVGCLDKDGDRYGRGPDCLGFDYNEEDATTYLPPLQPAMEGGSGKVSYLLILIWVIFTLAIGYVSVLLFSRIKNYKKSVHTSEYEIPAPLKSSESPLFDLANN